MIALGSVVVALLLREGAPPILAGLGGVVTGALVGAAIGSMVIGHIGRVSAVIVGLLSAYWTYEGLTTAGAIALGLAVCALLLALNERFVKRIPLPSFIITLGMLGALRGLAKGLGDSRPVYVDGPTWLTQLMQTSTEWPAALPPPGVWLLLLLALVMGGVLGYTRFGRHIFAVGSNPRTARLAGVHVERVLLLAFIVGIGCAGLAALLEFAFLGQGAPTTASGYELKVIAAVVIGGASLSGGEGSIRGTIIGALIMTVVATGCTKLELDNWVQDIVTGAIIVVAVTLDQLRQRGET